MCIDQISQIIGEVCIVQNIFKDISFTRWVSRTYQVIIEQLENRIRDDFHRCDKINLMLLESVVDLDHVKIFNTYKWILVTNKTSLKIGNNESGLRKLNQIKA